MDERMRRLWAGTEADAIGWSGVAAVARATGLAISTVRKGCDEVRAGARPDDVVKVRRKGGGRRAFEVAHPEAWPELEKLVDPITRGDPESPLRWTCKSTRALSAELSERLGFYVSDKTVAKMLKDRDYSLQAPNKSVEGTQHPDRNAQFADKLGLSIHVSHFPPGTSKWNKVEHRLFSFISINWRRRPLRSCETIINLISNTTNRGGLVVRARLDRRKYPTGRKVPAKELRALKIERDDFHGDWNYVIRPRTERR